MSLSGICSAQYWNASGQGEGLPLIETMWVIFRAWSSWSRKGDVRDPQRGRRQHSSWKMAPADARMRGGFGPTLVFRGRLPPLNRRGHFCLCAPNPLPLAD